MKKLIQLFTLLLCSSITYGQGQSDTTKPASNNWTDISIFYVDRFDPKLNKPLMWFSHEEGKYFLEARMNFDWRETVGLFIGKTFSVKDRFWVTPKVGFLFAFNDFGYNGFSPEVNLGGKFGNVRYFAMNQGSISFDKNPSFLYNYSQLGYKFRWIQFNYSAQFYYPLDGTSVLYLDQGPQLILFLGKFYFKPWYTWDPINRIDKFIVGAGFHF